MKNALSTPVRVACTGAGYFARYQVEAWLRIPGVQLVGICDRDLQKAGALAASFGLERVFQNAEEMLDVLRPDMLDIITPPDTHSELVTAAASRGIHIICQKPLAPDYHQAVALVETAEKYGVQLLVHENFRFQPWYRKIKQLIETGAIGSRLHSLYFRLRTGDGWAEDAYLARQPYFRVMPRLLVHETGIHFIDTFRFLAGEITGVYAKLRRLHPDIAGEDCAMLLFDLENGATAAWDANRYNESTVSDPRYTFGEMLVEGSGGSIRLNASGDLMLKRLGAPEAIIEYQHRNVQFAGDCVFFTQEHILKGLLGRGNLENTGRAYLRNLQIQEAVYQSAEENRWIDCRPLK